MGAGWASLCHQQSVWSMLFAWQVQPMGHACGTHRTGPVSSRPGTHHLAWRSCDLPPALGSVQGRDIQEGVKGELRSAAGPVRLAWPIPISCFHSSPLAPAPKAIERRHSQTCLCLLHICLGRHSQIWLYLLHMYPGRLSFLTRSDPIRLPASMPAPWPLSDVQVSQSSVKSGRVTCCPPAAHSYRAVAL